jgi:hypothetical protein
VAPIGRTGVLVVRIWVEERAESAFRARITATGDVSSEEQTSVVAASVDDVLRIVREWVDGFLAQKSDGDGSVTGA